MPRGNTSGKKEAHLCLTTGLLDEKNDSPCLVAILLEKKEARQCLETEVLGKKEADLLVLILSYFEIW